MQVHLIVNLIGDSLVIQYEHRRMTLFEDSSYISQKIEDDGNNKTWVNLRGLYG